MNLEKMMETYKRENSVTPREEKILETIQKSKEIVMEVQSENTMSYTEFLFSQFRLIRKLAKVTENFRRWKTSVLRWSMGFTECLPQTVRERQLS